MGGTMIDHRAGDEDCCGFFRGLSYSMHIDLRKKPQLISGFGYNRYNWDIFCIKDFSGGCSSNDHAVGLSKCIGLSHFHGENRDGFLYLDPSITRKMKNRIKCEVDRYDI
jgi:hypothetical protein